MLTELEKAVFQYIEEHREGMIDYLRRLVSVDTQTPPGLNYDRICNIMADRFSELGCETSVHEAPQKYLDLSGADFLGLEGPRSNVVRCAGVPEAISRSTSAPTSIAPPSRRRVGASTPSAGR